MNPSESTHKQREKSVSATARARVPAWFWLMAAPGLLLAPFTVLGAEVPKLKIDNAPLKAEVKRTTSFAPVVKAVSPSVVNVFTSTTIRQESSGDRLNDPIFRFFFGDEFRDNAEQRPRKEQNLGSAVIISEDGYLLSNHHVVEGVDEIKVVLNGRKKRYDAKVVGSDPKTEIAVLKIEATGLQAITLGDSDHLEVGDTVLALGNPFGVGQTVTTGIVSAKERGMGLVDYEDFIQTDASINPGNSGGALIDAQGRLVGINTAILSRSGANQGIGFAVPINLAKMVFTRLVEHGKVSRGYLGVLIQDITPALADHFNLNRETGALVSQILDDSPAKEAGIEVGDVIIKVDGQEVEDTRDLRFSIARIFPGSDVKIGVIRDGKEKTFSVKLDDLATAQVPTRGGQRPVPEPETGSLIDGVILSDLDQATRDRLKIPDRVKGVVVSEVSDDSPAEEAGLKVGDVIMSINRSEVRNVGQVKDITRKIEGDQLLLLVWSDGGSRFLLLDRKTE